MKNSVGRMDGGTGRPGGLSEGRIDGQTDGHINGRTETLTGGQTVGRTDGLISSLIVVKSFKESEIANILFFCSCRSG